MQLFLQYYLFNDILFKNILLLYCISKKIYNKPVAVKITGAWKQVYSWL
jgi:hypothetical protein